MNKFSSLCMSSYNRPEYLKNTIISLIENTKEQYEFIVHDDGSRLEDTYDTLDLIHCMGATVITNCPEWNQGIGTGLNRMFNIASGDPIVKLDNDQDFTEGWLTKGIEILDKYAGIGILGFEHYHHEGCDYHDTMIEDHGDWTEHDFVLGASFAVRRECWEDCKPFPEHTWSSDNDFMKKAVKEGWRIGLMKESYNNTRDYMGFQHSSIAIAPGEMLEVKNKPYLINGENK